MLVILAWGLCPLHQPTASESRHHMIYTTQIVTQYDAASCDTYEDRINQAIQEWQGRGMSVGVQYQGNATMLVVSRYTA
jgi:hypothetical protein